MQAKMHNYQRWIDTTYLYEKEFLEFLDSLLDKSGFKVLNKTVHYFDPQGCTALWLLSESHLAIHTFPERNKAYLELSSCVKKPYINFITSFYSLCKSYITSPDQEVPKDEYNNI